MKLVKGIVKVNKDDELSRLIEGFKLLVGDLFGEWVILEPDEDIDTFIKTIQPVVKRLGYDRLEEFKESWINGNIGGWLSIPKANLEIIREFNI